MLTSFHATAIGFGLRDAVAHKYWGEFPESVYECLVAQGYSFGIIEVTVGSTYGISPFGMI